MDHSHHISITGRYSPLRYPGGKGKLTRFVKDVIRRNNLSDGLYVEPYAGGAAIAWELLATGIVRRVEINDVSRPVFAFWKSVLDHTDSLCRLILETPVSIDQWDAAKAVFRNHENEDDLKLGFSFFFLNRTNRSGILNGGIIGGRQQTGRWKIDARYNKSELISRIKKIALHRTKIKLFQADAEQFITERASRWSGKTLLYIDPPYYEKGRDLYYNYYNADDHSRIAEIIRKLRGINWIVSYDDVRPIHDLYEGQPSIQYAIDYSARRRSQGRETMFFSPTLKVPSLSGPIVELERSETLVAAINGQ